MGKELIIYIFPSAASFIKKDIKMLSGSFLVKAPEQDWLNRKMTPINLILQFFYLCRHLNSAKAVLVKFGGYWSLLPSLLGRITGKPVYIILGGTDCVSFPCINYGSLRKPLLKKAIYWSFKYCTQLIPLDETMVFSPYTYYERSKLNFQGFKYHFPRLAKDYSIIPNGFDPDQFKMLGFERERNTFITVGQIPDITRVKLKGIDLIIKLARHFPECKFKVVGMSKCIEDTIECIPSNVTFYPSIDQEKIIDLLNRSEFYLQLSISEGFPNALCEGMLCGCIPIGSSVGAIPHIIDKTGFIITSSNFDYIKQRFNQILSFSERERLKLGLAARNRISTKFHIKYRERKFLELLKHPSTKSDSKKVIPASTINPSASVIRQ